MSTASVRCGDDLRGRVPGAYLAISDPVCQGPVGETSLPAYVSQRAGFVAAHYGAGVAAARARIGAEYTALRGLTGYGRVLLWFEHDLWDQACLLRVLSLLAPAPALSGRLFLMPSDGRTAFAKLSDDALSALEPHPLPWSAVEAGAAAWEAFADADPSWLDALSRRALPLPHLARALRRHLQDLPWTTDGLGLTERSALRAVAEGAGDLGGVFRRLAGDPVFPATDLIAADVLARLSWGTNRLVSRDDPRALTPRGAAVLAGERRWTPPPRFQGGVVVGPRGRWRWDPASAGVTEGRGVPEGGLFGRP